MIIDVTEKHITNGQRLGIFTCPVALAMYEKLNRKVLVDGRQAYIYDEKNRETEIKLSEEVGDWITNFDCGKEVVPISFSITMDEDEN